MSEHSFAHPLRGKSNDQHRHNHHGLRAARGVPVALAFQARIGRHVFNRQRLPEFDEEIERLYRDAVNDNKRLRYIAALDNAGSASVSLEAIDASHPFSNINLTDNIVQFETERYSENPLVIQGPGAGPEVTAGGVFSDLLRLANYLSKGLGYV